MGFFSRKKGTASSASDSAAESKADTSPTISSAQVSAAESLDHSIKSELPAGQAASATGAAPITNAFLLYGKIIRLLTLSGDFRKVSLGEIDALVSPAVSVGQVLVAETQPQDGHEGRPAAVALWASVSAEVDKRLSENIDKPWNLSEAEWRGGDIPWLILAVGDGRVISEMLRKFCEIRLKGRSLKMRTRGQDGKNILTTFPQDQTPQ